MAILYLNRTQTKLQGIVLDNRAQFKIVCGFVTNLDMGYRLSPEGQKAIEQQACCTMCIQKLLKGNMHLFLKTNTISLKYFLFTLFHKQQSHELLLLFCLSLGQTGETASTSCGQMGGRENFGCFSRERHIHAHRHPHQCPGLSNP